MCKMEDSLPPSVIHASVARSRRNAQELISRRLADEARAEQARLDAERPRLLAAEQRKLRLALQDMIDAGSDEGATDLARNIDAELLSRADAQGATALHHAAAHGLLQCTRAILERPGLDVKAAFAADLRGRTPWHYAAAVDVTGKVCAALAGRGGGNLRVRDSEGLTALKVAQQWGMGGAARALHQALEKPSANLDSKASAATLLPEDIDQDRPIDRASFKAGLEAVTEGRIDDAMDVLSDRLWGFVNETDAKGRTMLHHAALRGKAELCTAILARGDFRTADAYDKNRTTALHLAVAHRHVECCQVLLASERFSAVNAGDMADRTALHLAALRTDVECYETLLADARCNSALPDCHGKSAPEYALERDMDAQVPLVIADEIEL